MTVVLPQATFLGIGQDNINLSLLRVVQLTRGKKAQYLQGASVIQ